MQGANLRPFYHDFAWAYEALIDAPLAERCAFIERVMRRECAQEAPRLLDAGCGPGHYSAALAQRGFHVLGLDSSETFVQQAQETYGNATDSPQFLHGDILQLGALTSELSPFDRILCRGVLNDLIELDKRQQVFYEFARALRPRGILLFDVREWTKTVERIESSAEFVKTVTTSQGELTFRSSTTLDHSTRQMRIHEYHHLRSPDGERILPYEFVMQCWTRAEVVEWLEAARFQVIQEWGAYDDRVERGTTDRMVICARLLA